MSAAADLLSRYAQYHRDRRNIASHFVGVPLIVFSIGVLLAQPTLQVGGFAASPAWLVFIGAAAWYLTRGAFALGVAVSIAVGVLIALSHQVSDGSLGTWFAWGVGSFVVGWLIQFAGHWYEGRKPAFVDDIVGLLVAPMFVTAEALFMLGWNRPLADEIERRAGPTVLRDLARIA